MLQRKQKTGPLDNISAQERFTRLKGAISFNERFADIIKHRPVLIIDAVLTPGATLSSAAVALINAGCKSVDVAVLARSIKEL